jgi:hypothetical protein
MKDRILSDIFDKAVSKFGVASQALQLIEEMAELTIAMNKFFFRSKGDKQHVIEELVDVEIMIEQMKYILKEDDSFNMLKQYKLDRLKDLLDYPTS